MKKLIAAADIKQLVMEQKNTLYVDEKTIVTPAAQDAAKENGVKIVIGTDVSAGNSANTSSEANMYSGISSDLVSKIVEAVMLQLGQMPGQLIKEIGECGLIQVKGSSVVLERFDEGTTMKEVLSFKDSPGMSAGIMEMTDKPLDWTTKGEEIKYVLEGILELNINGKKYTGKQGDIFFIPANTRVIFSSPKQTKFFYIIHA